MNALPSRADVVVIGLGAAGSAALSFLARAGANVVGIDRFSPPHDMGSSHGETRMLRTAYSEGAAYVPMVRRAITLWRELEHRTGTSLFHQTGVIYGGPHNDAFLGAAKQAAYEQNVRLVAEGAAADSTLAIPGDWQRLIDVRGGYLNAEASIGAFLQDATANGATVIDDCDCSLTEPADSDCVVVDTERGSLRADRAIITAGAWSSEFLRELRPVTHIERRVLHWFKDESGTCSSASGFRPFLISTEDNAGFYGFPANPRGEVKVGEHFMVDKIAWPHALRPVDSKDAALIQPLVDRFLPRLGSYVRSAICMYPMSRDEHFIIDRLPGAERIAFAAGLGGHGFKFAPVLGEALTNFVLNQRQQIDVGFFSLRRFPEFQ